MYSNEVFTLAAAPQAIRDTHISQTPMLAELPLAQCHGQKDAWPSTAGGGVGASSALLHNTTFAAQSSTPLLCSA